MGRGAPVPMAVTLGLRTGGPIGSLSRCSAPSGLEIEDNDGDLGLAS